MEAERKDEKMEKTKNKNQLSKTNKSDLLFYCLILAWPVLQFCVFYIGVNFNSIIMSFKEISIGENGDWIAAWVAFFLLHIQKDACVGRISGNFVFTADIVRRCCGFYL